MRVAGCLEVGPDRPLLGDRRGLCPKDPRDHFCREIISAAPEADGLREYLLAQLTGHLRYFLKVLAVPIQMLQHDLSVLTMKAHEEILVELGVARSFAKPSEPVSMETDGVPALATSKDLLKQITRDTAATNTPTTGTSRKRSRPAEDSATRTDHAKRRRKSSPKIPS
ncbi:hypothetical protein BC828DRAFT_373276 [Blastocladiella britannica]|nr:hypothetical protein BC828DRAFT_373276 [Blastocladiella britannica]